MRTASNSLRNQLILYMYAVAQEAVRTVMHQVDSLHRGDKVCLSHGAASHHNGDTAQYQFPRVGNNLMIPILGSVVRNQDCHNNT